MGDSSERESTQTSKLDKRIAELKEEVSREKQLASKWCSYATELEHILLLKGTRVDTINGLKMKHEVPSTIYL